MKISVVTPSYNQGKFLEETIDSVLSQGVDDLEYIIMDGGSTDNSVEIIKKYEKHLKYWVSEPDEGQTQAIKKGFEHASGDILCYLNSDDIYFEEVLKKVLANFEDNSKLDLLYGDNAILYPDGRLVAKPKISYDFGICLNAYLTIPQPSSFWSRRIYDQVGGFNSEFQYCFDYDFFLRVGRELIGREDSIRHVKDLWSKFRVHDSSKTVASVSEFSRETKILRSQFDFNDNKIIRPLIKNYFLLKALFRFYSERKMIPLSSGPEL
ncbi:glycosyltransferase family 2 protein [Dasania marina]|uniref:glycosyltransferase family 2 protein n=1 Tax=Dasania marina TaxID=471499 RepID=UPI0030DDCB90|tara:strand:- start:32455 stop:33252 length:798 start_codon:yes stop_codon:yes gene_type:complete